MFCSCQPAELVDVNTLTAAGIRTPVFGWAQAYSQRKHKVDGDISLVEDEVVWSAGREWHLFSGCIVERCCSARTKRTAWLAEMEPESGGSLVGRVEDSARTPNFVPIP